MSDQVALQLIKSVPVVVASVAGAVGSLASIIGAYYAYRSKIQGEANHAQGEENHKALDGRMQEMLNLKGAASKADGVNEERERGIATAKQVELDRPA